MYFAKKNTYDNFALFEYIEKKAKSQGMYIDVEISVMLGIAPSTYAYLKNGNQSIRSCRRRTLEKIATYTGLPISTMCKICGVSANKEKDVISKSAVFVRQIREEIGLSKQDASRYFGLGKNAFSFIETARVEPPFLLLLVLKILDDQPDYIDVLNELMDKPDPKQDIPTYFSYMRRKLNLRKYEASHLFGLGKNAFSWIEIGNRKPATLLLMIFKLLEQNPELIEKVKLLSETRSDSM